MSVECGLGNRENPSEPTTLLSSPQYGKAEATEISSTVAMIDLTFLIFNQGPRDMIDLNLLISLQVPRDNENQKS